LEITKGEIRKELKHVKEEDKASNTARKTPHKNAGQTEISHVVHHRGPPFWSELLKRPCKRGVGRKTKKQEQKEDRILFIFLTGLLCEPKKRTASSPLSLSPQLRSGKKSLLRCWLVVRGHWRLLDDLLGHLFPSDIHTPSSTRKTLGCRGRALRPFLLGFPLLALFSHLVLYPAKRALLLISGLPCNVGAIVARLGNRIGEC